MFLIINTIDSDIVAFLFSQCGEKKFLFKASSSEMLARFFMQSNILDYKLFAVAVNEGPGHYTPLKVILSFAKALCFSLNIPLISYSIFEVLNGKFLEMKNFSTLTWTFICFFKNASYFTRLYRGKTPLSIVRTVNNPKIFLDLFFYSFKSEQPQEVFFVGENVKSLQENFCAKGISSHTHCFFYEKDIDDIDIARHTYSKYRGENFEDLDSFVPNYQVKAFHNE